jgi:hypothetical protein
VVDAHEAQTGFSVVIAVSGFGLDHLLLLRASRDPTSTSSQLREPREKYDRIFTAALNLAVPAQPDSAVGSDRRFDDGFDHRIPGNRHQWQNAGR